MATRYCNTCGVLKPLEAFRRNAAMVDGHEDICKECRNARDRARYSEMTTEERQARSERTRARAARRSLNWERVHQLLIEVILGFPQSAQAQDLGKQVEAMLAGAASKPLPRGGAPQAWDVAIDLRAIIRGTEGAQLAVECALALERLDVLTHVLIPRAEAAVAWTQRQHSSRRQRRDAASALNGFHAERRVLEKRTSVLRQMASYTRAMDYIARRFYAYGVR